MSLEQSLEEKFQTTQLKMQELTMGMEKLELEYQNLLEDLGLTAEQLQDYATNPDNFSQPIWEQLQNEKKQLDEKLNLNLNNVRDPLKVKKTLADRGHIQQHWIFVR